MVEISYADVGEEYQHDQKNRREIPPVELRRSGTCNPIRMDISSTCHLGHRILVRGSGEYDLQNIFPCLFFGKTITLSPVVGVLSKMPVRRAGLGLMNPVTSDQEKYLSSTRGSTNLIWAVTGGGGLSNADHLRTISED